MKTVLYFPFQSFFIQKLFAFFFFCWEQTLASHVVPEISVIRKFPEFLCNMLWVSALVDRMSLNQSTKRKTSPWTRNNRCSTKPSK